MAREFAKKLYSSAAWAKNSKRYMNAMVDLHGHVVTVNAKGFCYQEDGEDVYVPEDQIVPPRMCERCYSMGVIRAAKLVHHKVWLTPANIDDKKIALGYDNFMRVCQDCHAALHHPGSESRVTFDEDGNVVPKEDSVMAAIVRLTEGL